MNVVVDERKGGTSASNAEADLRCPGRHLAQKGIPEEPPGPDAEGGRLIHRAFSAKKIEQFELLKRLTPDQRDVFDRAREIERKFLQGVFPEASSAKPMRVFREQRLWVLVDGKFLHSGQPDVVFVCGSRGAVIDYKTLMGDTPESSTNQQLRDYAVLASGHYLLDEVTVLVDQPWVTMDPVPTLYKQEHIKRAEAEMFQRVRASNDPNSLRAAGKIQCTYCRAKMHCAEYQRFGGAMIPGVLTILDVPVSDWTPEQRAIFCENRAVAQKWLDDVGDAMREGAAKDPSFIKGWHLVDGNERRTIVDPQSVFNRFVALGGNAQKFMGCVSVTIGKLKEAVNDLTGARGKALDAAINTITEGLIEVKRNSPSLKKIKEDE